MNGFPSGSLTVPSRAIVDPSEPETFGPASTVGGALTETTTEAVFESSLPSLTLTETVELPAALNVHLKLPPL